MSENKLLTLFAKIANTANASVTYEPILPLVRFDGVERNKT